MGRATASRPLVVALSEPGPRDGMCPRSLHVPSWSARAGLGGCSQGSLPRACGALSSGPGENAVLGQPWSASPNLRCEQRRALFSAWAGRACPDCRKAHGVWGPPQDGPWGSWCSDSPAQSLRHPSLMRQGFYNSPGPPCHVTNWITYVRTSRDVQVCFLGTPPQNCWKPQGFKQKPHYPQRGFCPISKPKWEKQQMCGPLQARGGAGQTLAGAHPPIFPAQQQVERAQPRVLLALRVTQSGLHHPSARTWVWGVGSGGPAHSQAWVCSLEGFPEALGDSLATVTSGCIWAGSRRGSP